MSTCLLQHRLDGTAPAVMRSCEQPATHAWFRPGKSPIPCCARGIAPGRDVRPLNSEEEK